uniref:Uncharacterized protein n=1 Tax=Anopheles epiroticus TaxID=199890 RepID=A0A182P126_9DIPT
MFKLVCMFALIAVVASLPNGPARPILMQAPMVKREAIAPEVAMPVGEDTPVQESAVEAQDDMDKAETFGFGYHKVIHVLCLLAVVAVVSAGISQPNPSFHQPRMVKREAEALPAQEPKEAVAATEGHDDMDKAETFGFGYHKFACFFALVALACAAPQSTPGSLQPGLPDLLNVASQDVPFPMVRIVRQAANAPETSLDGGAKDETNQADRLYYSSFRYGGYGGYGGY